MGLKRFWGWLPGNPREVEFYVVDEDPDNLGYFMRKTEPIAVETAHIDAMLSRISRGEAA